MTPPWPPSRGCRRGLPLEDAAWPLPGGRRRDIFRRGRCRATVARVPDLRATGLGGMDCRQEQAGYEFR